MQSRRLAIALSAAIGLGSCDRLELARSDPTFGRSFDECILKNANKGDADAQSTASAICERHFVRRATAAEASANRGPAIVNFAAPASPPDAPWQNFAGSNEADNVTADIRNMSDDLVIKKVVIDAYFYSKAPGPSGVFDEKSLITGEHWFLDADIEPGQDGVVTGTFNGGKAPSRFYKAFYISNDVVPHTERRNPL